VPRLTNTTPVRPVCGTALGAEYFGMLFLKGVPYPQC